MKPRKQPRLIATAAVAGVLAVAAGCGGTKSTASRSAEQYDAARAKGEPVKTEAGHGGHAGQPDVADTASPGAPMDHAAMGHTTPKRRASGGGAAMDLGRMAGMAHGRKAGTQPGSAAMDHSRMTASGAHAMPGMGPPHPAQSGASSATGHMDHSAMAGRPRADAMAGMQHAPTTGASSMPAMQHGTMTSPLPEPPARVAAPAEPARTLQPDPLDMPAPTAVEEAARAAAIANEMAGGHAMSHGTYRQIDAGRDPGTTAQPHPSPEPHLHHQPSAPASPSPRPSPTPKENDE
jgi:hypothetical protein